MENLHRLKRMLLIDNSLFLAVIFLFLIAGCGKKGAPEQQGFAMPVVGVKAVSKDLSEKIFLIGTLKSNESIEIKNEVAGLVEKINFKEGQSVSKGTTLFQIDTQKLKAAYDEAEANLKLAEATAQRYENLVKSKAVSTQEYDQTKATWQANRAAAALTKAQLEDASIQAPFDGFMGERLVSVGQFISQGTTLGYLFSNDPMKAEFHVAERFLSEIKVGQKIQLSVAAFPKESFEGNVYFIDPQINEVTRTALVKATVPNKDNRLKRGMFANLELVFNVNTKAIVIPETALIVRGDTLSVYAVSDKNQAEMRMIKAGVRRDGVVEIKSGIAAGETVITEGYQKIGPGMPVHVKLEDLSQKKTYEII